jgi:hypothetical protein
MKMIVRRMMRIAACALAAVAASPAPRLAAQTCPAAAAADTTEWRRIEAGSYSLRLPGSYQPDRQQRINTAVRDWTAPHFRGVHAEYGLSRFVGSATPVAEQDLICDQGPGDAWRIVVYELHGRFGIGYYGFDPTEPGRALALTAESPRREDLPELLAIIHSVRWTSRPPPHPR